MKLLPITRVALLLFGLLPLVLAPADRASGQEALRIAAVVNNEAISIPDLVARIDIAILSSRLQISDELRQQLAPQVLPLAHRRTTEGAGGRAPQSEGQQGRDGERAADRRNSATASRPAGSMTFCDVRD